MIKKKCLYIGLVVISVALPIFAFGPFQLQHFPNQFSFYRSNGFDRIRVENFILQGSPGSPELPVKYLHYIIPPNMKVTNIRVISRTLAQIPGNRYIFPAQPIVPLDSIPPWAPPDTIVYNSDSLYPSKFIEVSNSGIFDGARLVTIAVYPLQYRPRSRRIFLVPNITFEFSLSPAPIPERANIRGINGQRLYDSIIKVSVENKVNVPTYYQQPTLIPEKPPEEEQPGVPFPSQYTIITADELVQYFLPFANWLTDKGVPASVVPLKYILNTGNGDDDAEKLRNYITYAWKECGTIWVLLGGDAGIIPFRYGWAGNDPSLIPPSHFICPSDLYFSDLNGNWDVDGDRHWGEPYDDAIDIYPEVYGGRILVRNPQEVTNWVNKILYYEQYGSSDPSLFRQTTWIYDSLYGGPPLYPWMVTRELFPSYFTHCNINSEGAEIGVHELNLGAGLYQVYCHGDVSVIATRGSPFWWKIHSYWDGPISNENDGLNRLNNGDHYYVVYSIGCYNAAFDDELPEQIQRSDTTIADAFTDTYESSGAVAFLGNTRYGWYGISHSLHHIFCQCIFYYNEYNQEMWFPQLGTAESWSKAFVPPTSYYYLYHAHNLFGSPEMEPWINSPGTMEVEHPISIPTGVPSEFRVTVKDENGNALCNTRVCLNKPGDIYEVNTTGKSGITIFYICPKTEGDIKVTCFRPRQKPPNQYVQYLPSQTIC